MKSKFGNDVKIEVLDEFLEKYRLGLIEFVEETLKEKSRLFNAYFYFNNLPEEQKIGKTRKMAHDEFRAFEYSTPAWVNRLWSQGKRAIEEFATKEVKHKRENLIARVEKITGKITDARGLRMGANGELNGVIIGELGKAKIETISAGGYNIQCYHFRVLIKKIK